MNEQELLAKVGLQHIKLEQQDEAYRKLLNVLAGVVSGVIAASRVLINVTEKTWLVTAEGERPGMPATINGLPLCVVAPPDPVPEVPVLSE